ncbi:hypothetical protein H9Y04_24515 [Streptomyces sp. TRM66268-LWL]|uniref:Uncharacterized protein n=1 Tax=Streptomyces polyasparticus TaxID=2767826 RepID=A0ABR7SJU9_9ACTN|nr:hypothetical protein [Streptomyces polyasparticus]MBC9715713.1 hypothetical protein [Streptomyces polyasparticus]
MRDISYTPGTDALRHISPLLLQAQDLTATALVRLKALDNSTYTGVPGSRASLDLLASVVSSSSLAGTDLAHMVLANPYEGAEFAGYPATSEAIRTARHAEAIPKMNGHLDDAVHQLDLCAIGCHYLAHGITEDLATTREHKPSAVRQPTVPALTSAQYDALTALNSGGHLYRNPNRRKAETRVAANNGARVSMATYRVLAKHGLVTNDTRTSLVVGQTITVTEQGQQSLTQQRPHIAPTTTVVAAPKAVAAQGAHR